MTGAATMWKEACTALHDLVSEATWKATFEEVRAVDGGVDELVLLAPNSLVKERLDSRFLSMVRDVIDDAGGTRITVRVEVKPVDEADDDDVDEAEVVPYQARKRRRDTQPANLNPEYTFEAFVIGEANKFAHAAARSTAETPAQSYNPLFIYGASGLGKTHLLHAIGHYVQAQYPDKVVSYVSTETFMNEYVDMIRTNTGGDFRRRYRNVDVLLIDDVQFLAGKEGTQEEFFHTFNEL
ncbi:MAG: DnaA/Hda family protein, partial [Acidimicrobiales bacterium]